MKSFIKFVVLIFLFSKQVFSESQALKSQEQASILVFSGAANQKPLEEVSKIFKEKTGVQIDLIFGGSGAVLSQMKLSKKGDIYFPGSSDYMEKAKNDGDVLVDSEEVLYYLIPVINVQKGNPKKITSLKDLLRDDLKIVIGNPETVCLGTYAEEIIRKNFSEKDREKITKKIVNYAESCEKVASTISLKQADVVIGWHVFESWDPKNIETIKILKEQLVRIGSVPIAISKYSKNKELAKKFIDFLKSDESKKIFSRYHYFSSKEEVSQFLGGSI